MRYLNKKTQAVIETACVVFGGDWVAVENQPKKAAQKTNNKKATKKSGE